MVLDVVNKFYIGPLAQSKKHEPIFLFSWSAVTRINTIF